MTERKETEIPILLTPTQDRTAGALLDFVRNNKAGKFIVTLDGLSGVGKSTVLNVVQKYLSSLECTIVDPQEIVNPYGFETERIKSSRIIAAATPSESRKIDQGAPKNIKTTHSHI